MPGDVRANMLAAYNAGVYAVLHYGGVPPYPKPQAYVSRILALEPSFAAVAGTVPASSAAAAAIAFAQAAVGIPYRWGGDGGAERNGEFDCSGLTQAAYPLGGINLPHNAAAQWFRSKDRPRTVLPESVDQIGRRRAGDHGHRLTQPPRPRTCLWLG